MVPDLENMMVPDLMVVMGTGDASNVFRFSESDCRIKSMGIC